MHCDFVETCLKCATCAKLNGVLIPFLTSASQKIKVLSVLLEVCLNEVFWYLCVFVYQSNRITTVLPRPTESAWFYHECFSVRTWPPVRFPLFTTYVP